MTRVPWDAPYDASMEPTGRPTVRGVLFGLFVVQMIVGVVASAVSTRWVMALWAVMMLGFMRYLLWPVAMRRLWARWRDVWHRVTSKKLGHPQA
jgi:hypothetical protein